MGLLLGLSLVQLVLDVDLRRLHGLQLLLQLLLRLLGGLDFLGLLVHQLLGLLAVLHHHEGLLLDALDVVLGGLDLLLHSLGLLPALRDLLLGLGHELLVRANLDLHLGNVRRHLLDALLDLGNLLPQPLQGLTTDIVDGLLEPGGLLLQVLSVLVQLVELLGGGLDRRPELLHTLLVLWLQGNLLPHLLEDGLGLSGLLRGGLDLHLRLWNLHLEHTDRLLRLGDDPLRGLTLLPKRLKALGDQGELLLGLLGKTVEVLPTGPELGRGAHQDPSLPGLASSAHGAAHLDDLALQCDNAPALLLSVRDLLGLLEGLGDHRVPHREVEGHLVLLGVLHLDQIDQPL